MSLDSFLRDLLDPHARARLPGMGPDQLLTAVRPDREGAIAR